MPGNARHSSCNCQGTSIVSGRKCFPSGYLTLKHPLPAHFEVTAALHFTDLGIGWDPGLYLYAGTGTDMVAGVSLMPAVLAWGISHPIVVARTPKVPAVTGNLNFNMFSVAEARPGTDILVKLAVCDRLAEVTIAGLGPISFPLPARPSDLVVGAFRWTAEPAQQYGAPTRCCVRRFSFRGLA